ncbi:MAG: hypothetical protein BroJett025_05050 [Patescibacteria group bacterium]|nr:MAG: hypothetical protein BroJett025_05050 [Patescibacteria group bacterium]
MSIFQIGATLFALFMMYVVSIHKNKSKLSLIEMSFWYSMWGLFVIIALFPDLLTGITQRLSFQRVFDLLLVLALMVLTVLVVLSYFMQKENQKKLEEFVRKQAIDERKKAN